MGFFESFTSILGAVYDVVTSVFQGKTPEESAKAEAQRPTQDGSQFEDGKTQVSGTKPTTEFDSKFRSEIAWDQFYEAQSGSNSEQCLPFGDIQVGVWYRWTIPKSPESSVLVYGCTAPRENVWRFGFPYPDVHQRDLWFHGTDYKSVLNIIENGIKLQLGKGHQDFSYRDGFYLSPDFENARRWACNDIREKPAVIVFKFGLRPYKGLDLEFNESDWEGIVRYNRSGRIVQLSKHVQSETLDILGSCDYISGPINGRKDKPNSKEGWETWIPTGFNKPYRQLCIRSEALARDFGNFKNIDSIILY